MSWTPGPWLIDGGDFVYAVHKPNGKKQNRFTADIDGSVWTGGDGKTCRTPRSEVEANARLIAAAPELAEVLQELWRLDYRGQSAPEKWDKAREALRKAGVEL